MIRKFLIVLLISCLAYLASAETITLKIRAINQLADNMPTEVRVNLPAGVGTNEVINSAGLDISYDVQDNIYYVHQKVELGPKEIRVFDVEIKDIWIIPEEDLSEFQSQASKLVGLLSEEEKTKTASDLKSRIDSAIEEIRSRQQENKIKANTLAMRHITAFDANKEVLNKVKKYVGLIENLVLASGIDPGKLMGSGREVKKSDMGIDLDPKEYKKAIYRITIKNPSELSERKTAIKQYLPKEINVQDVVEPGDLSVGRDPVKNRCYLYKDSIVIPAGQSVTYEVKIRDKWNVNEQRIVPLKDTATLLYDKVVAKNAYKSVEQKLQDLISELEQIELEKGPEKLNSQYVAFYRDQAKRLDVIEQSLVRIKELLTPIDKSSKLGFKAKPPSMKSTWLIIYVILGFLAVMSLLFFLRWYGKTSSELMDSQQDSDSES